MANLLPYFKWYPNHCEVDEHVKLMDDKEFGFYVRCLNHSWENYGLPADLREIARMMNRSERYVEAIWERVGKCFVEETPGRLVNPRQEKERKLAESKSGMRREAAELRWKDKDMQSESKHHAIADAKAQTRAYVSISGSSEFKIFDFSEKLYARHPKKQGRILAQHALSEIFDGNPDISALAEKIDKSHAEWCDHWYKTGAQFAPRLANWLRDGGFEDDPPESIVRPIVVCSKCSGTGKIYGLPFRENMSEAEERAYLAAVRPCECVSLKRVAS